MITHLNEFLLLFYQLFILLIVRTESSNSVLKFRWVDSISHSIHSVCILIFLITPMTDVCLSRRLSDKLIFTLWGDAWLSPNVIVWWCDPSIVPSWMSNLFVIVWILGGWFRVSVYNIKFFTRLIVYSTSYLLPRWSFNLNLLTPSVTWSWHYDVRTEFVSFIWNDFFFINLKRWRFMIAWSTSWWRRFKTS